MCRRHHRFWHATQDCVAPYVDIILHRGRFWAKSAASGSVRWWCFRSCWMVLSHVMRGRPSCLLQSARGEANRILLACVDKQKHQLYIHVMVSAHNCAGWLLVSASAVVVPVELGAAVADCWEDRSNVSICGFCELSISVGNSQPLLLLPDAAADCFNVRSATSSCS